MRFHITLKSSHVKTGPIPVSTTSSDTCPDACSLKHKGCYAESGPLGIHWRAVDSGRGTGLTQFCETIKSLPAGQLWRHNQAGDLPGDNNTIDVEAVNQLIAANLGKRGFTYTHKPMDSRDSRAIVRGANKAGFTINLSADNVQRADELKKLKIGPVVVVVPEETRENFKTPAGNQVVICPAATRDNVSCATCKLCAWSQRDVIIAFPAHGSRKKLVSINAR